MGIDCGMGSDPLKIQQNVKMYTKEPEAELICLSRKNRYINELIGVCDKVYKYKMWSEVFSIFESDNSFDYIIIEDHIMGYKKMISRVYDELLAPNGFLVLFALEKDKPTHEWIKKEFKNNLKYSQKTNLSSDFDEYNRPERIGRFIVIEKGMDAC